MILLFLLTSLAFAQPWDVERRDKKFPTQVTVEKDIISAPIVADTDRILNDEQGDSTGSGKTVISFLAAPDVPRNITVVNSQSAQDVKAGTVVVNGKNFRGKVISENFVFIDNQSSAVVGSKAFSSITSIVFPPEDSPFAATWDVGVGDKLGLRRCLSAAGHFLFASLAGVKETTAPTVTADPASEEGNTIDLDSAYDGSSDVEFFYFQSYRCP